MDKIFRRTKFSTPCLNFDSFGPIFAWLLYWNIGQNFRRTKCFVAQNYRHQAEISTLLSDEFLSDNVPCYPAYLRTPFMGVYAPIRIRAHCGLGHIFKKIICVKATLKNFLFPVPTRITFGSTSKTILFLYFINQLCSKCISSLF